jgi:hypothetical protein
MYRTKALVPAPGESRLAKPSELDTTVRRHRIWSLMLWTALQVNKMALVFDDKDDKKLIGLLRKPVVKVRNVMD